MSDAFSDAFSTHVNQNVPLSRTRGWHVINGEPAGNVVSNNVIKREAVSKMENAVKVILQLLLLLASKLILAWK
jgi:hypothetical protein